MTREISAVEEITETEALKKIEAQLAMSPRRPAKGEVVEAAEGDVEGDNDDLQEEAA